MKALVILIFLFPALLLLSHIGAVSQGKRNIDPVFVNYYDSFLKEEKSRGLNLSQINITIQFKLTDPKTKQVLALKKTRELAHCRLNPLQDPVINVDPTSWKQMTKTQKEMTIYHELGHCLLLKGHNSSMTESRHISIMNPIGFNSKDYISNKEDYLNELFSYKPYHIKDYAYNFIIDPIISGYQNLSKNYF